MTIWKQGQFYPELGKMIVELPNEVNPGPSDDKIKIDGFNVQPDENGDFIHGSNGVVYTEDELDAISTYAVVRMVINLYEELLGKSIHWSWWENGKGDPLLIKIRNNDINARFIKEQKCIELDYYGPYKNWTYNCRSVDLIAHETGHAILDSILPNLNNGRSETRGIGEAFCDLTAMFWILSQKHLCEYVIHKTKGNLTKNSILTLFGVGYGYQFKELRTSLNDKKYPNNNNISYDYSQVLVGVLYEILNELYCENKCVIEDDSENLFLSGQIWMKAILSTYNKCPISLSEFGEKFSLEHGDISNKIKKHFKRRGII